MTRGSILSRVFGCAMLLMFSTLAIGQTVQCDVDQRSWACSPTCQVNRGILDDGCPGEGEGVYQLYNVTYAPIAADLCFRATGWVHGLDFSSVRAECRKVSLLYGPYDCRLTNIQCKYRNERARMILPCTEQDKIDHCLENKPVATCQKYSFTDDLSKIMYAECTYDFVRNGADELHFTGPFSNGASCLPNTGNMAFDRRVAVCDGFDRACSPMESATNCGPDLFCKKRCSAFNTSSCTIIPNSCASSFAPVYAETSELSRVRCAAGETVANCPDNQCYRYCDATGSCTAKLCVPVDSLPASDSLCLKNPMRPLPRTARSENCTSRRLWTCKSHPYGAWSSGDCSKFVNLPEFKCEHGEWTLTGRDDATCVCEPGWTGLLCNRRICKDDCSEHGVCDQTTGQCTCGVGRGGQYCEFDCSAAPCLNGGLCTADGTCTCAGPWKGATCNVRDCNVPFYNETSSTYQCCDPTRTGRLCQVDAVSACAINCNGKGECLESIDDPSEWYCFCNPGFSGIYCNVTDNVAAGCPLGCANGECVLDELTDTYSCMCYTTYLRDSIGRCTESGCRAEDGLIPPFIKTFGSIECERIPLCSNGGVASELKCACPFPYIGATCEQHVCSVADDLVVDVNGKGTCGCKRAPLFGGKTCRAHQCASGEISADNAQCICPLGYTGTLCESYRCPRRNQLLLEGTQTCTCSDKSVYFKGCVVDRCGDGGYPDMHSDTCICPPDFEFDANAPYPDIMCVPRCLNSGVFNEVAGTCECLSGFEGRQCATQISVRVTYEKESVGAMPYVPIIMVIAVAVVFLVGFFVVKFACVNNSSPAKGGYAVLESVKTDSKVTGRDDSDSDALTDEDNEDSISSPLSRNNKVSIEYLGEGGNITDEDL